MINIHIIAKHGYQASILVKYLYSKPAVLSCIRISGIVPTTKQYNTFNHSDILLLQGVKPASFDKVEIPEVRDVIERCIRLKKEERQVDPLHI